MATFVLTLAVHSFADFSVNFTDSHRQTALRSLLFKLFFLSSTINFHHVKFILLILLNLNLLIFVSSLPV